LFPSTVNNWRADVPITPKVVWKAVNEARKRAGISKPVAPRILKSNKEKAGGRSRRVNVATRTGRQALKTGQERVRELFKELTEDES
jgi:hypothetical protein